MSVMVLSLRFVVQARPDRSGGALNVDLKGRPIDPARYVDRGKQGKTEELLLLPVTLSPNLEGQNRRALERVLTHDKRVALPPKETTHGSHTGTMSHFVLNME